MDIRRVQERDLGALAGMVTALASHHGDVAATSEVMLKRDCLGAAPWLPVWVAEGQGRLLGYAACQRRVQMQVARRGVDLHHLYVESAARGLGVGRALVRVTQSWACEQGCEFMTVATDPGNHAAQAFYLGLGFDPVEIEAVRFVCRLEARHPGAGAVTLGAE